MYSNRKKSAKTVFLSRAETSISFCFTHGAFTGGFRTLFYSVYIKWKINSSIHFFHYLRHRKKFFYLKYFLLLFSSRDLSLVYLHNFLFHSFSPLIYSCIMTLFLWTLLLCAFAFSSILLILRYNFFRLFFLFTYERFCVSHHQYIHLYLNDHFL